MDEQPTQEIPQETPRQRTLAFKVLVGIGAVLIICIIAAGIAYATLSARIETPLSQAVVSERIFVVEKGDNAKTIAARLERERFIADSFLFEFYAWNRQLSHSLQAGKYLLSASLSPKTIAEKIAQGDVMRNTVIVTIPEGFTMRDIEERMRNAGLFEKETTHIDDFFIGYFREKFPFFSDAPGEMPLEGYLFPDTYEFEKDTAMEAALERMLANFGRKTNAAAHKYHIIIMASLIEKEVITPKDMKLVSGILWKRLAIGMPLQVDATVVYATGRKELTYDDLDVDSPYNTYRRKGIPAGPISNPGMNAILAAINPTASDYLYYISKPNKETVFSRTLKEHNAAVAKYLR